jgi:hypothetical protein
MFADPISVRHNGIPKDHVRTGLAPGVGTFTWVDSLGNPQTAQIKQNLYGKRKRTEIRLSLSKIAENALTATNQQVGTSVYLVIDRPPAGFNDTELNDLVCSLCVFLTQAEPENTANVLKALAGEY